MKWYVEDIQQYRQIPLYLAISGIIDLLPVSLAASSVTLTTQSMYGASLLIHYFSPDFGPFSTGSRHCKPVVAVRHKACVYFVLWDILSGWFAFQNTF